MPRVRFDASINFGHILTIISIVGSVFVAYMNIVRTVDGHELRLVILEKQFDNSEEFQRQLLSTLTEIREDIATLKERSKDAQR